MCSLGIVTLQLQLSHYCSDAGDFEDINMDQVNSGDEFEYVHFREAAAQSKDSEVKAGKRATSKGSAKNKSKGKSWKKSS